MAAIRGKSIGMIFQDPMTSLNPVLTIGRQMSEVLQQHLGLSKGEALRHSQEYLELVGSRVAAIFAPAVLRPKTSVLKKYLN